MKDASRIGRLKRRADFVRVGKGRRWHGKAFTLQATARAGDDGAESDSRVGFTLTRKVGCAVVRNRARRRLKEAVRLTPNLAWRGGHDYVILGRTDAIRIPFAALAAELAQAVGAVTASKRRRDGERPDATGSKDQAGP